MADIPLKEKPTKNAFEVKTRTFDVILNQINLEDLFFDPETLKVWWQKGLD